MKILYIDGEDFGALHFENKFSGTPVDDILRDPVKYFFKEDPDEDDEYENWRIEVFEFGNVDTKFIEFVRDMQDYDDSKHRKFYVEGETIC